MKIPRTAFILKDGKKRLSTWTQNDRKSPPPKTFVLIPYHIMELRKLEGRFSRREKVKRVDKTYDNYIVELEAVPIKYP